MSGPTLGALRRSRAGANQGDLVRLRARFQDLLGPQLPSVGHRRAGAQALACARSVYVARLAAAISSSIDPSLIHCSDR
jgi:hypothetical protein